AAGPRSEDSSPMPAVEFVQIGLRRGARAALEGIDWRLEPGELHLIAGPAGAGKSSLLAAAGLALRPAAGEARVLGRALPCGEAEAESLRRRIGRAEQTPRFLEHLSVIENVALPLRLDGRAPEARAAQARELLDWLGLADRAQAAPGALSGAERRRAALARAVIAGPELILADEPSAELDRAGAAQVLEMLAALADHGAAVAMASRDPELIGLARRQAGARLLTLEAGRLRAEAA
ncbi:MAG: ATP-binding cassette domain-containing protein, partial [Pseudomonadota bacterium]